MFPFRCVLQCRWKTPLETIFSIARTSHRQVLNGSAKSRGCVCVFTFFVLVRFEARPMKEKEGRRVFCFDVLRLRLMGKLHIVCIQGLPHIRFREGKRSTWLSRVGNTIRLNRSHEIRLATHKTVRSHTRVSHIVQKSEMCWFPREVNGLWLVGGLLVVVWSGGAGVLR